MTTTQQGVLTLVKSALTGAPVTLPEGFDWPAAANILIRQGLSALGYAGAALCGIAEEDSFLIKMQDKYCMEFVRSERQIYRLTCFYQAMEEQKIPYMPVKGAVMKAMYPAPEMRNMGDADILIHPEHKAQIAAIMEKLGYEFCSESDHEWNWFCGDLKMELHKRLVSSDEKTYYGYFGDGWKWAKLQEGCRYTMSQEDAFIFEFSHFTRHYCKGGIGLRHMIDLWVHLDKAENMDMTYIRAAMAQMRLGKFFENVLQTLQAWFHGGESNSCTDYITEFVFGGGTVSHNCEIAESAAVSGNEGNGKAKIFLRRVFPAKKHIEWNYPQYSKLPLPVAWVARWCSLLKKTDTLKQRTQSMKGVTDEKIDAYRNSLARVGLEIIE